ncbi:MAG TPA: SpoIIE family protein phosphatase [Thermoleophilaceae bacterium]|nr:SpoIIE family protein phosphatase [Thermoleophilaceae bacterium]
MAPLVAAAGEGVRRTAIVYVYSVILALVVGFPDHFFGSADHLGRVATVAVGGGLALWIAHLRERRETDAARLATQYAVARALSDSDTLEEAAPRLLEAIGGTLGWALGGTWVVGEPGALRCVATWEAPGVDPAGFDALSREVVLRRGVGLPGRAWELGRPVWLADVTQEENFPRVEAARRTGLRAAIAFPALADGEVLAVFEFFGHDARPPDRDLIHLMGGLGRRIGEFLKALRGAEALRESEARKGAILASALDCVITMDHEGRVVEFNRAAERAFGYRQDDVVGRELAELIVPPALRERHRRALLRYLETGRGTILGRRVELTGLRADDSEFPVEVTVTRVGGQSPPLFTGYLRDITERKRVEDEREALLRREQESRLNATRARDQLEAIVGGIADAVTAVAPDGRLLFANEAAVRTLGYSSVEELLASDAEELLARFEMWDETGRPLPPERLPGRRAFRGEEAEEAIRYRNRETGEARWSLVKATPIFDEDGRVEMAINLIEDITEHKRSEHEQAFLSESSRLLASSLDPDEVLERIAELAVPDIADWCAVEVRREHGAIEQVALTHADPDLLRFAHELQERYPPDPNAPTGAPNVLRTGRSELYTELPDELLEQAAVDEEHLRLIRRLGLRSAMVVPLIARGRTLGALTFVSGASGRRFTERDLGLAEELGRRCANALENARIYSERDYIAQTLQQSLLPAELPSIPGLEAAARFRPTGGGMQVGGDFYDLFETGEHGWTVVVGDVCGKGPDAAAVTALARYTLRAAAMRARVPSRNLWMLNEALLRQRQDLRFCTVACAYFEPTVGGTRVLVASGGHPLPLILRHDGAVEPFGEHGTLLGVLPDPDLHDQTTVLGPGDALIFYTDGVIEARGPGGALSEERLHEVLAASAGLDAEAVAARIESAVLAAQGGGPPRDDVAVLVLRLATTQPEARADERRAAGAAVG